MFVFFVLLLLYEKYRRSEKREERPDFSYIVDELIDISKTASEGSHAEVGIYFTKAIVV